MASQPRWSRQVATQIKRAIRTSGWSENHVADTSGIALSTLRRRLSGATPWTVTEIEAIARTLRVDPDVLVTSSGAES